MIEGACTEKFTLPRISFPDRASAPGKLLYIYINFLVDNLCMWYYGALAQKIRVHINVYLKSAFEL